MMTLDAALHIPANVSFCVVGQNAFLLNTRANQYYALEESGARLWDLLKEGKPLRASCQTLLDEYEVEPAQLEQDVFELIGDLMENGLVELDQA